MTTTMSVVNFSSTQHKLNLIQQTTTTNNNNNNNPPKREIIILRKQHPILPQPKGYVKNTEILITNTARKRRGSKEGLKSSPQPMAVARRNARERNRVKQVNNGFANLRQRIPSSIAAAFESNAGRGNNKKLSKVETLRMAVEYIRTLEDILAVDDNSETSENVSTLSLSVSSFPSPTPSSPALTTQTSMSYNYPVMSPSIEDDDMSCNSTPPPQHYLRIGNLISPDSLYDNSESLQGLDVDDHLLSDPALIDANLEFGGVQDLTLLHGIHANDSLSPGFYSEPSLSPDYIDEDTNNCFISVFNGHGVDDSQVVSPLEAEDSGVNEDLPVLSLKSEQELPENAKGNMEDVMQWWEQQETQPSNTPS